MGTSCRVTVGECGECGELHKSAARAQERVLEDLTGWPWGSGSRGVVGGGRCPSPGMDTTPDADVRLAGQRTKGAPQSTLSHGVSQAPGCLRVGSILMLILDVGQPCSGCPMAVVGSTLVGLDPRGPSCSVFLAWSSSVPTRGDCEGSRAPLSHGRSSPGEPGGWTASADVTTRRNAAARCAWARFAHGQFAAAQPVYFQQNTFRTFYSGCTFCAFNQFRRVFKHCVKYV